MFVSPRQRVVAVRPAVSRRFPRTSSAVGSVALLACFLTTIPAGFSAPPSLDDNPQPALLGDDGFTRETLTEFNAPEPAAFAAASVASVEETHRRHYARTAARHRRQLRRERSGTIPQVVVKSAPRRNPVESFVYWWNGFVINTFHTKVGTVMLRKIGAKT